MRAERAVAVFAKAPLAGTVKTRLIARLGEAGAARLHEQLVERALATTRAVENATVTLWIAGDWPAADALGVSHRPQSGADLGARMLDAITQTLTKAEAIVVVGADCPAMTPAHIEQAFTELLSHDVVVVPATDGGYVLIGMRAPHRRLFEDVSWGTPQVTSATRARCAQLGLRLAELPPLDDLDTPDDLQRAVDAGLVVV